MLHYVGEFGIVYHAELALTQTGEKQAVAAKTIKGIACIMNHAAYINIITCSMHYHTIGSLSQTEVDELKKECRIMCQLQHPNVLTPINVCVDVEVPYLIMPLMERGSLLTYLRKEKDKVSMPEDTDIDQVSSHMHEHVYKA